MYYIYCYILAQFLKVFKMGVGKKNTEACFIL